MSEKRVFLFSCVCLVLAIEFCFLLLIWSVAYCTFVFECKKDEKNDEEVVFIKKNDSADIEEAKKDASIVELFEEKMLAEKESLGEFKLTAYCSCEKCCGNWALNRPKDENGKDIIYGSTGEVLVAGQSIAVDPKVISYGSEVEINGHTYTAQDCGGAIKGNRIDVYFNNHQDALEFGVQYAEVFLFVGSSEN